MLLRRITEHVRAQNWTAVTLDFFIVVVGVFIGIQVANWNDAGRERLSESQYLQRIANEIELTITHLQEEREFSEEARAMIDVFVDELYRDGASDDELLSATNGYLSTGAFFANFRPIRTTFDDIVSTGNFEIIKNGAIRTDLIKLYAHYEDANSTIESNIDWIQQGEDRIYYDFDAFRFDTRTEHLFDNVPAPALANDVREQRDLLRRHAAFHYWLKVRSIELFDQIEPEAETVLILIKKELNN